MHLHSLQMEFKCLGHLHLKSEEYAEVIGNGWRLQRKKISIHGRGVLAEAAQEGGHLHGCRQMRNVDY